MRARSVETVEQCRKGVEFWSRLSDRIIPLGPWGIGLDGLTAFIPGVGELYGTIAGVIILSYGVRVRASPLTLILMALILIIDVAIDVEPILGQALSALFLGHRLAALLLLREMNHTHYVSDNRRQALLTGLAPSFEDERRSLKKQRLVYLG